ncbi:MAG: ATP:cob(I)alamin adenosyltransferase [Draconibacterium sp.]|nr:MAG: ATP:cob(I)alamin adenosyltransferase [Draconibacterium sp.]PIF05085.1 MAG: ATP:cob(I)alamin adenosyltransferase [Draconibacterium sp.]
MVQKARLYTKTGDEGTTGLVGGSRVKKNHIRLEAYGTIDELNSAIGIVRSNALSSEITHWLEQIQHKLFDIGSRLASDEKGLALTAGLEILPKHITMLEKAIDEMEATLPELRHFILPGGEPVSAQCHAARTICRRAERRLLDFAEKNQVQPETIIYINRLSDFLFVLARRISHDKNAVELAWKKE